MVRGIFINTRQPQRINPPRWIRRIRIQIQPTRITNRILTDKPADPWIIVPIPIVVQPCFVIVVLPLKPDRVGQALALCPFGALLFDFSPRFVLRAPGDLAGGVGQFLWRAQVVALVPGQYVNRQRLRGVGPQRVLVNVVGTGLTRLGQQAHRLVAHCLGRATFPGEGVAVEGHNSTLLTYEKLYDSISNSSSLLLSATSKGPK